MDRIIDDSILTGIADAIREKTGESGLIVPENMAAMISQSLPSGVITIVNVRTKSTGNNDAALYAQKVEYNARLKTLTPVGQTMDISFWPFYNSEITELNLFNTINLKYINSFWTLYAIGTVICFDDMSTRSDGELVTQWHYTNQRAFYFA